MRRRFGIALLVLLVLAGLIGISESFSFMNEPDDGSVLGGIICLVLLFIFLPTFFIWIWNFTFKHKSTPKIGE
jgi:hypothetical protein